MHKIIAYMPNSTPPSNNSSSPIASTFFTIGLMTMLLGMASAEDTEPQHSSVVNVQDIATSLLKEFTLETLFTQFKTAGLAAATLPALIKFLTPIATNMAVYTTALEGIKKTLYTKNSVDSKVIETYDIASVASGLRNGAMIISHDDMSAISTLTENLNKSDTGTQLRHFTVSCPEITDGTDAPVHFITNKTGLKIALRSLGQKVSKKTSFTNLIIRFQKALSSSKVSDYHKKYAVGKLLGIPTEDAKMYAILSSIPKEGRKTLGLFKNNLLKHMKIAGLSEDNFIQLVGRIKDGFDKKTSAVFNKGVTVLDNFMNGVAAQYVNHFNHTPTFDGALIYAFSMAMPNGLSQNQQSIGVSKSLQRICFTPCKALLKTTQSLLQNLYDSPF